MVGEKAQLETERLRALDLFDGDERVVFQTLSVVVPGVGFEHCFRGVEGQLDCPLTLGVHCDVIADPVRTTELLDELLEFLVEQIVTTNAL